MTDGPLVDTWASTDLPVLRQVVRVCKNPMAMYDVAEVAAGVDLPLEDVEMALLRLSQAGYFTAKATGGMQVSYVHKVSERARREAGQWPTPETGLDRIIAALESIADNTDDEDTRTKAERFATWLRASATTVGLSVASAAITGQLPGAGS